MKMLFAATALFFATSSLNAAPMVTFNPPADMVVKVAEDGQKKPKNPQVIALKQKYKALREAAKGDKAKQQQINEAMKAEMTALRSQLGLLAGKGVMGGKAKMKKDKGAREGGGKKKMPSDKPV